jgi:hypothetical protein
VSADWLERHTRQAPPALSARARDYAAVEGISSSPEGLARAGQRALAGVLAHPGDRSAALDLLAADALVTLALLAQAQQAPERLDALASSILDAARPNA